MSPDFELYDELPAEGDWPGGFRYGYIRSEQVVKREWTDEEKLQAYKAHIWLPETGTRVVETWWDQPYRVVLHAVDTTALKAKQFNSDAGQVAMSVPLSQQRIARPYGRWFWKEDQLDWSGQC